MFYLKSNQDFFPQFFNEINQFFRVILCNSTDIIILGDVFFLSAGIKIENSRSFFFPQNFLESLNGYVVVQVPLSPVTFGI